MMSNTPPPTSLTVSELAERSPFTDRREDIVPRSLRDLLAAEASQAANERRRRRQRKAMAARRVT